jgi:hypothetical protein
MLENLLQHLLYDPDTKAWHQLESGLLETPYRDIRERQVKQAAQAASHSAEMAVK